MKQTVKHREKLVCELQRLLLGVDQEGAQLSCPRISVTSALVGWIGVLRAPSKCASGGNHRQSQGLEHLTTGVRNACFSDKKQVKSR